MDESKYHVVRALDGLLPAAAKAQKAGISLDIRLYLSQNPDGGLWASVSFLDREGHLLKGQHNSLPLDKPDAVGWFFDQIATKGFPLAEEMRTTPLDDS